MGSLILLERHIIVCLEHIISRSMTPEEHALIASYSMEGSEQNCLDGSEKRYHAYKRTSQAAPRPTG